MRGASHESARCRRAGHDSVTRVALAAQSISCAHDHHAKHRLGFAYVAERLGVFALEMRNLLSTAAHSFDTLKGGQLAIGGTVGAVLDRRLHSLNDLIERSLAEVRLESNLQHRERIVMIAFIEEIEVSAAIAAKARARSCGARNQLLQRRPIAGTTNSKSPAKRTGSPMSTARAAAAMKSHSPRGVLILS